MRYKASRLPGALGGRTPRYYLTIGAIFRNEAQYLAEWVTFHRLQGVERFWLYDNNSTDDWRTQLAPELGDGIVNVKAWPDEPGQGTAYADCLESHRSDSCWIAFIDVDEFLFSPTGEPLSGVLQAFDRHPGVVVNWRMFGPSGHRTRPEGLVIENYVRRAADDYPRNQIVKSIVQPRGTWSVGMTPHAFEHLGSAVGEHHQPQRGAYREPPTTDLLRINHYFTKSQEEWERKLASPRPDKSAAERAGTSPEYALPPEDVSDEAILRYVPAVRAALDQRRQRLPGSALR